ncbi:MAG: glycosyltransferase [Armatimonadetes bacterium]|nr:glycosyltransferase [Armatimonadota bacterium]
MPSARDPFVVHSHLRWGGVWQRPQQILSRMARRRPIFFVEEPILLPEAADRPFLSARPEGPNLVVLQPHVGPQEELLPCVSAVNRQRVADLLRQHFHSIGLRDALRWHYSPMALSLRDVCPGHTVVYDCMDELSAFKGAPAELPEWERQLIQEADVVFTGGRSLYLQKRDLHAYCHRFDSGVEIEHFQRACHPETPVPPDVAALPRPILGYYGVLDERLDLEALRALARADSGWQIVLVGPVTKISPDELPQAPNLHYLGPRPYAELPGYLKTFDVCLVPFARNEATRFLSPTKTLEYFAGEKPVVSSPVPDVVENYANIVWIAREPEEYVRYAREALSDHHQERIQAGLARAKEKTWDRIVAEMETLLEEAIARNYGRK